MYPNFKNIFKPNSKSVMKLSLTLKGLVGTIATSAFIQNNAKFAFYALVAGALIEFLITLLPPDAEVNDGSIIKDKGTKALLLVGAFVVVSLLTGCWSQRPALEQKSIHRDSTTTNHTVKDTTITSYKAIDLSIKGAKVASTINLDSLFKAALMAKDQRITDSIANLKQELKYKQDSIAALKAGLPMPVKPVIQPTKPDIRYYTDPQTKAQLAYWIDAYGKFQITCESKDQTITIQQAQITVLRKDVTDKQRLITDLQNKTITISVVPKWAWYVMGISILINLLGAAFLYLKIQL